MSAKSLKEATTPPPAKKKRQRNMGGPKNTRADGAVQRTEGERERDLLLVTELYVKGRTLYAIAEALNKKYYPKNPISRTSIKDDIDLMKSRWQERYTSELQFQKLEELGKIDKMEDEYWTMWDKIKDPRYMQGIQWCITKRCDLLGLNAPVQTEANVRLTTTQIYLPDNGRGDGPSNQ